MRFPIKLNQAFWPANLTRLLPSAVDPRPLCAGKIDSKTFSSAVSTFKFGSTFKSTQPARFPLTLSELARLPFPTPPVILDIGASDGSTSLDVMVALNFERYYVTDLNIAAYYETRGPVTWFYAENGSPLLRVTNRWVIYPDLGGALFPFNLLAKAAFQKTPKFSSDIAKILLINPTLLARQDARVEIQKHNLFDPWLGEKSDLILAANILNPGYFTPAEIELGLQKLLAALKTPGRLVIIDNRPAEKASIFHFDGQHTRLEKSLNGGADIESLALKTFSASYPLASTEQV